MSLRGGRYEILGTIASGGMATVHLGRALGAGGFERLVAVKTMHPHLAHEEDFVAMFLDEARLAARIRHPNVVATVDVQQDEEGLFLVMEYIEGPSLSRLLRALKKKDRHLPLAIGLRIFLEALAGLQAAHELTGPDGEPLNLIHRDVSPHNILVGTDGISRLTDFGVAKAASRLASTRTGSAKGKINYMAPEQARSEAMDRRVDIYSAGVVLWETLTGERMIQGDSDMAIFQQIVQAQRRTPHEVLGDVPEEISAVTMRAIERDAAARFPTAAAFAEALEAAARACGIAPAPPRDVAKFVKEQQAHIVVEIPPAGSQADPIRRPMLSVTAHSGHALEHLHAPRGEEPSKPSAPPTGSVPAASATVATVALPGAHREPSRGGRTGLLIGAGVLVLAAAVTAIVFASRGGGESPANAASGVTASASANVTAPASAPVSAVPPMTAKAADSAPATESPTATATATTKATAHAGGAGTAAPKTFRPKDL
ncbi:MAG: serine/threonine-protein kinase [Polyangiaceae bacterium]